MEKKNSDGRFLKVANILILAALLVITGLLASLHWRLARQTEATQPVVAPQPLVAPAPVVQAAPAPAPAPRRAPRAPAPTRNYTQEREYPAISLDPEPAPIPAPVVSYVPPPAPVVAQPVVAPAPQPAQPQWAGATIPSGTILTARLIDTLHSDQVRAGDSFRATLEEPIYADGLLAVPRGSTVEGRVVGVERAGRVTGVAELAVELDRLLLSNGQSFQLLTDTVTQYGETSKKADVAKVGTGAAIGAIIGAIGGGGKGAAIGAASGAGAGTAGVLLTRGKPVILTPETRLSFQLRAPVSVEILPGQSSDYRYTPGPSYSGNWEQQRPRLRRR